MILAFDVDDVDLSYQMFFITYEYYDKYFFIYDGWMCHIQRENQPVSLFDGRLIFNDCSIMFRISFLSVTILRFLFRVVQILVASVLVDLRDIYSAIH